MEEKTEATESVEVQTEETVEAEQTDVPQTGDAGSKQPSRFKKFWQGRSKKFWLVTGLVGLVILGGIGGGVYAYKQGHKTKPAAASATNQLASEPTKQEIPESTVTRALKANISFDDSGYTLLDSPQKIDSLHLVKSYGELAGWYNCKEGQIENCKEEPANDQDASYYRIGATKTKQPLFALYIDTHSIQNATLIFVQDKPAHYTVISGMSSGDAQSIQNGTVDSVDAAPDGIVPSQFSFPSTVNFNGVTLKRDASNDSKFYPATFSPDLAHIRGSYFGAIDASAVRTAGQSSGKTIYQVTVSDKANFRLVEFYVGIGKTFVVNYQVDDSLITDKAAINWADGTKNSTTYSPKTPGCGSAYGYVVAKNVSKASLTAIGTGPSGQVLYKLPDNNPLLLEIYNDDYAKGENIEDAKLKNMTLAQFQDAHGVFVATNALGETTAYIRGDLFAGGGCGKPVVYLYPTKPTMVNVQVGAHVTKSEPLYPTGSGWQHVVAQPNGQLTYHGKGYDSLYWEGQGYGLYPNVTSGTIVAQEHLISTIKKQLAQQGLNDKEIRDFLNFWQPRLPQTAYVRLTWFTTEQLNNLAPLKITPKPQTVIRTFLDFQGLDYPRFITPQHFRAPTRNGFTVVEWGGLIRE